MIRIGYVGINTSLPTAARTLRLSTYTEERMLEIAKSNIQALKNILLWNQNHGITLFRITSQIIPFGSHPVNSGIWKKVLQDNLAEVGNLIKKNSVRVSMHPGQYTVLNTPNEQYYQNTIADLQYHTDVLSLMRLDATHRIVVHGGGGYGDKINSLRILTQRIKQLPEPIYNRLMLENDDKVFTAADIHEVCLQSNIPAVLDVFHHNNLPSFEVKNLREVIQLYKATWSKKERQKIQYSNQDSSKSKGAHSISIDLNEFGNFYRQIEDLELDIMLEVKDKEQSVMAIKNTFPQLR